MKMKSLLLALFLVLALNYGEADVSCDTALDELSPCAPFVVQGGSVSDSCCNGIRTVKSQAQTTAERQSVCNCIKSTLARGSFSSEQLNNALVLSSKCGVNLPFKCSPSTDCDSVQ